ncbi:hypothetical protein AAC387_Pa08g0799 [Persea americana]
MASASEEIVWHRRLLREFGAFPLNPAPLYADNTNAFRIATNTVYHERTKHIEIDYHFIRQQLVTDVISLPYVSSHKQLADDESTSLRSSYLSMFQIAALLQITSV